MITINNQHRAASNQPVYGSQPVYANNQQPVYSPPNYSQVPATEVRTNYPPVNTTSEPRREVIEERNREPVERPVATSSHVVVENRGSNVRGSQTRGSRFDEYRHKRPEYKYNFFSLIDEPWNRCCEFGKCGSCPGNECIAKREPRMDWL